MFAAEWRLLKEELQSSGVFVESGQQGLELGSGDPAGAAPPAIRRGGAGPAQGLTLLVDGRVVSVPVVRGAQAAYRLVVGAGGTVLHGHGRGPFSVDVLPADPFADMVTSDGVSYGHVALIHGGDCLASTVIQTCVFWSTARACRFCAIGASLRDGRTVARKSAEQLVEVASVAAARGLASHVVLTTGCTEDGGEELAHLASCTRALKESVDLPVGVQLRPPRDPAAFEVLRSAGVDTVGLHIESLDPRTLAWVAPTKAEIGWRGYVESWRQAVAVFGRGQVSTYVIMGLGEHPGLTARRLRRVAELGVFPHVVPFRPVPGSLLEHHPTPSADLMRQAYAAAAGALRAAGLSQSRIKAGCGRCTACSALPEWESQPLVITDGGVCGEFGAVRPVAVAVDGAGV